jgi:hypothetical protein
MAEFWEWLKAGQRFLVPLVAAGLVAVAIVATPLSSTTAAGPGGANSLGSAGYGAGQTGGGTGAAGLPGATSSGGGANPAAGGTAGTGGASGTFGSGAGATAAGATAAGPYQGVTAKTVKWGFSAQKNGCGGFNQSQAAAAYGFSSDPGTDYPAAQDYFNKYPLVNFPLPAAVRQNVNAKNGYWGRHITSVFRDSGGLACPDVGRANAVTMAEQDKVFGEVMRGNEGPEIQESLVMAQHHLIFIGRQNTGPAWFKARAPYFYDGDWGNLADEGIAQSSWICRDWIAGGKLNNGKAYNTGDPTVSGMPRKFGILHDDDPDFNASVVLMKKELAKCGVHPNDYSFPVDLQTLETNIQSTVSRMHQDGITTVIALVDFITPLTIDEAATNQGWHPEWVRSGSGLGWSGTDYRTFGTSDQSINTWIAADNASIHAPNYYNSEAYKAWKKVRPTQEPDSDWASYYYQFKVIALGMAGAGPDLNPTTFGQGLAKLCGPCSQSDPLLPIERYDPANGHYTNWFGFTLMKYDPNKVDPTAPRDNSGAQPKGYFDFLENGKRYGERITDPL